MDFAGFLIPVAHPDHGKLHAGLSNLRPVHGALIPGCIDALELAFDFIDLVLVENVGDAAGTQDEHDAQQRQQYYQKHQDHRQPETLPDSSSSSGHKATFFL